MQQLSTEQKIVRLYSSILIDVNRIPCPSSLRAFVQRFLLWMRAERIRVDDL